MRLHSAIDDFTPADRRNGLGPMMLDADVVAGRPSSFYRVPKTAGLLGGSVPVRRPIDDWFEAYTKSYPDPPDTSINASVAFRPMPAFNH